MPLKQISNEPVDGHSPAGGMIGNALVEQRADPLYFIMSFIGVPRLSSVPVPVSFGNASRLKLGGVYAE